MRLIVLDLVEDGIVFYGTLAYRHYVLELLKQHGFGQTWVAVQTDPDDVELRDLSAMQTFVSHEVALTIAEFLRNWAQSIVERRSLFNLKLNGGRWYMKGLPDTPPE